MFKWRFSFLALIFLLASSNSIQAVTHDVTVGNNFFSPNDLTIQVGDTVRWTNNADRTHDVTADDFSWASETSSSFTFERTFNTVEEVLYHCTVHSSPGQNINSNQNGRINVVEGTANQPPTADFSSSCTDLECSFTDQSTDSDGTISSWSWNFGDGDTSNSQNPSHTYAAAGTYSVMLTVTDNDGDSNDVSKNVTVTAAGNQDPNASFTFTCFDLDCNFSDASSDPDGTISAWDWAFGDGGSSTASSPSYSYAAAGTYTVSLTVTDNDGAQDTTNRSVTVTEPGASFVIVPAISDAWFDPLTAGQGFFIIVWQDIELIFLSWFTYDTERPPEDVMAILGEPGHRWLTAQGPYVGDTAVLDVFLSSGGTFDSVEPVVGPPLAVGTITITWTSCNSGTLVYDLPALGLMGEIPIERIVLDNVPACEAAQPPQ